MNLTLLILAGGIGSRYGSFKQIEKIGPSGERIIDYSVYDAIKAGFKKVVYVINKNLEAEFKESILSKLPKEIEVDYVCQELDTLPVAVPFSIERRKPWGTGHALLVAETKIKEPFAIINADDFYGYNSFKLAVDFLKTTENQKSKYALIGYSLENTLSAYGTVSRGICKIKNNYITSVEELLKIRINNGSASFEDESNNWHPLKLNDVVSMNFFAFTPDIFLIIKKYFIEFLNKNSKNLKIEFGLPNVIDNILKHNEATLQLLQTNERWFGLTYKEDKEIALKIISELIKAEQYPNNLWKAFYDRNDCK